MKTWILFYPERRTGIWQCYNVCPVGCWTPDYASRKATHDMACCIACGASVLQCPEDAIELGSPAQKGKNKDGENE